MARGPFFIYLQSYPSSVSFVPSCDEILPWPCMVITLVSIIILSDISLMVQSEWESQAHHHTQANPRGYLS